MQLSTEERRALVVIAALIVLAAGARWLERPRPLLEDVAALDLDSLQQASTDAKPPPRGAAATSSAPIDPNRATPAELMTLPGVGAALAARIVAERERAPFTSVADMRRVSGIGVALSRRLVPLVALPEDGPASAFAGTSAAARVTTSRMPPAARPATSRTPERGSAAAAQPPQQLVLSLATAAELERVSGVGPVLAARLVQRRDSLGGFTSWDEVDAVSGVGPALLERLKQAAVLRRTP